MGQEIIVSTEFLEKAKMSASELTLEVAVYLYDKKKLTMGQAKRLVGLDQIAFQKELGKRGVYIHYEMSDVEKDLRNLNVQL